MQPRMEHRQTQELPRSVRLASSAGSPDTVSFDDFFNAATSGSSPGNKEGDPSKDDLDQFQTWLQNLKR